MRDFRRRSRAMGWFFLICFSRESVAIVDLPGGPQVEAAAPAEGPVASCKKALSHYGKIVDSLDPYLQSFNSELNHLKNKIPNSSMAALQSFSSVLDDWIRTCPTQDRASDPDCLGKQKQLDSLMDTQGRIIFDSSGDPVSPGHHDFEKKDSGCVSLERWHRRAFAALVSQISSYLQRFQGLLKYFSLFSKRKRNLENSTLTPLMLAACLGQEEVVKKLLQQDSNALSQRDPYGKTLFHYATHSQNWNIIHSFWQNLSGQKPFYSTNIQFSDVPLGAQVGQTSAVHPRPGEEVEKGEQQSEYAQLLKDIPRDGSTAWFRLESTASMRPIWRGTDIQEVQREKEESQKESMIKARQDALIMDFAEKLPGLSSSDGAIRFATRVLNTAVAQTVMSSVCSRPDHSLNMILPTNGGSRWTEIDVPNREIRRFFGVQYTEGDLGRSTVLPMMGRLTVNFSTLENTTHGKLDFLPLDPSLSHQQKNLIKTKFPIQSVRNSGWMKSMLRYLRRS